MLWDLLGHLVTQAHLEHRDQLVFLELLVLLDLWEHLDLRVKKERLVHLVLLGLLVWQEQMVSLEVMVHEVHQV